MIRRLLGTVLLLACVSDASAGDRPPISARQQLALTAEAARAWADDAMLIYAENDETVGPDGRAPRWGFLYWSATRDRARAYSVDAKEIVVANDLDFTLDAPPVRDGWIDSARALQAAEDDGGRKYREKHQGHLRSMLLIRGAFHQDSPDQTTWTLVYDSPGAPSYFVVVDAENGKVVRQWKG